VGLREGQGTGPLTWADQMKNGSWRWDPGGCGPEVSRSGAGQPLVGLTPQGLLAIFKTIPEAPDELTVAAPLLLADDAARAHVPRPCSGSWRS
jgi:hypothetical protein